MFPRRGELSACLLGNSEFLGATAAVRTGRSEDKLPDSPSAPSSLPFSSFMKQHQLISHTPLSSTDVKKTKQINNIIYFLVSGTKSLRVELKPLDQSVQVQQV